MRNELATRLDRAVAVTFGEGFTVLETGARENPPWSSVLVGSTSDPARTAFIRLDGVGSMYPGAQRPVCTPG